MYERFIWEKKKLYHPVVELGQMVDILKKSFATKIRKHSEYSIYPGGKVPAPQVLSSLFPV